MAFYLARRILTLIPVWIGVTLVAFLFIHAIPGGPFDTGAPRPPQTEQLLKRHFHLDQPLPVQYGLFVNGVLHGDLGQSLVERDLTTTDILRQRLPTSAELGLAALLVALGVGFPAGVVAALHRNKATDHVVMFAASLGYALPNFVLSIILILVFGLKLGWLPLGGWGGVSRVVLPAFALGLPWAGLIARLTRAAMLEALSADHVRMAQAKGLPRRGVLRKHVVRNALLPVITLGPVLVAELIVGSLVVETIFGIPGVGQYFIGSVLGRDYSLMLGFIVFYATLVFLANLLVDVAYVVLDPRIRLG